jgi:superfamily II DNA/RNA helicase/cold shock CspA family protein
LAFGITIVARCTKSAPWKPQGLVLVPTRELAAQIEREIAQLHGDSRRVLSIYGGTSYNPARKALSKGVDIVVACPGRLEDLVEQGSIDLRHVTTVVVDEADRMADMGFLPAVRRLLDVTPAGRQVLLFSATLGREIEALVNQYQDNPVRHDVTPQADDLDVEHHFWLSPREGRAGLTAQLVSAHGSALVFCRTRHGVDRLARQLKSEGIEAAAIHGDRTQAQRERALQAFSRGHAKALVATDVAARGIHVDDLPCVVHYDLPADATDYLHRSGRTGRAGKAGTVVSLVTNEQRKLARTIQRTLGIGNGDLTSPTVSARRKPLAPERLADTATATAGQWRDDRSERTAGAEWRTHRATGTDRPERPSNGTAGWSKPSSRRAGAERPAGDARPAWREDRPARLSRERDDSPAWREDRPARLPRERDDRPANRPRRRADLADLADRSASRPQPGHPRGGRTPTGTVKFFNPTRGFGFLSYPDGDDLFVHYSHIEGFGPQVLEVGQRVAFEVAPGRKGAEARKVRVI